MAPRDAALGRARSLRGREGRHRSPVPLLPLADADGRYLSHRAQRGDVRHAREHPRSRRHDPGAHRGLEEHAAREQDGHDRRRANAAGTVARCGRSDRRHGTVSAPTMAPKSITLDALNGMSADEFRRALGAVFEHSPWVAERAWPARPFPTLDALHAAMAAAVRQASREEQLALLRAHPDLGGKASRAGAMTEASVAEQSSAGLDRLSLEEYERFERLNTTYRAKFDFPFVIAVRHHDKRAILSIRRAPGPHRRAGA